MAHAQKLDLIFPQNGRVHLNRRGASVQSTTGSRGLRISGSNAGYTMFRGSVNGTDYPLHSPVSPSLPLPCVTVCHHISTGVYCHFLFYQYLHCLHVLSLYQDTDANTKSICNVETKRGCGADSISLSSKGNNLMYVRHIW